MNFHAVKQDGRTEASAEIYIQSADDASAIFKSSVSNADIRRNRQAGFALQIFTESCIKRLSARSSDAV